jgi:hypothetical protein
MLRGRVVLDGGVFDLACDGKWEVKLMVHGGMT